MTTVAELDLAMTEQSTIASDARAAKHELSLERGALRLVLAEEMIDKVLMLRAGYDDANWNKRDPAHLEATGWDANEIGGYLWFANTFDKDEEAERALEACEALDYQVTITFAAHRPVTLRRPVIELG